MKGRYSADELERARRIADAVRGLQSNQDLPDNVGGREGYVVGAVATLVIMSLASIAWWFLREPQTNRIPSMTTSTQRAEERNHSSSTSNAMPTQTSGPRLTPAAPQRAAPEKFNPYVTRTTPVRTMAPSRSTPNTSPVSFTMDTHGRIAANHAENYFENEYVLGSSELEVRTVTATPISSAPVAGWPHILNQGNVEIRFYNRKTGDSGTTRRGYEAITTVKGDSVVVGEFTVKAPEYRP